MFKIRKTMLFAVSLLLLAGCSPLERHAYNVIVSSNAFIKSVKSQHPECQNGSGMALCGKISQAVSAKDALIDAVEIYCAGPDFNAGGKCNPPSKSSPGAAQASDKLRSALLSYEQIEKDLKGVVAHP